MEIVIVAALARNGVIGRGNDLPWRLPDDLKRFKAITRGHPVIMGRKTFATLKAPLPERKNIVLSRSPLSLPPGVVQANDAAEALRLAKPANTAMIIGGSEIYRIFLAQTDRLELTEIDAELSGDVYFPPYRREEWREVTRVEHAADDRHAYRFSFVTYVRATPKVEQK